MPRADGSPTIKEILLADRVPDPAKFLADLTAKLGHDPEWDEIGAELGDDPREDKPWPPEEDCKGCDKHKDGPHRFSCAIGGKQQLTLPVK